MPVAPSYKEWHAGEDKARYSSDKRRGSENIPRSAFGTHIDAAFGNGGVWLAEQQSCGFKLTIRHLQSNAADSKRQMPSGTGNISIGQKGKYPVLFEYRPRNFRLGKAVVYLDSNQTGHS